MAFPLAMVADADVLLRWLGERPGPFIDNLNAAERQGWVANAAAWFELRRLRNPMIHEYVEDLTVLAGALNAAHAGVPLLLAAALAMRAEIARELPQFFLRPKPLGEYLGSCSVPFPLPLNSAPYALPRRQLSGFTAGRSARHSFSRAACAPLR